MASMYDDVKSSISDMLAPVKQAYGWAEDNISYLGQGGRYNNATANAQMYEDTGRGQTGMDPFLYTDEYDSEAMETPQQKAIIERNAGKAYDEWSEEDRTAYAANVVATDKLPETMLAIQSGNKELAEKMGLSKRETNYLQGKQLSDWVPTVLPKFERKAPSHQRTGGGSPYRHSDEKYYNYVGTFDRSLDPLNTQLGGRIAGRQRNLLGLGK